MPSKYDHLFDAENVKKNLKKDAIKGGMHSASSLGLFFIINTLAVISFVLAETGRGAVS